MRGGGAEGLGALGVLVVDDNAQMRTIVGTVLASAGVRSLHYAPDGQVGLDTLRRRQIDIVFVDQEMPRMDGMEFLAAVRGLDDERRYTPVIMLTGHSDLTRLLRARDLGVNEFLTKPVSARTILERLTAVILHPRPFVHSQTYFGPDRRRRVVVGESTPRRRKSDREAVFEL